MAALLMSPKHAVPFWPSVRENLAADCRGDIQNRLAEAEASGNEDEAAFLNAALAAI